MMTQARTDATSLPQPVGAIMALTALPWLPASVRDIRAFRAVKSWTA
jgi:hypothetical protein